MFFEGGRDSFDGNDKGTSWLELGIELRSKVLGVGIFLVDKAGNDRKKVDGNDTDWQKAEKK